MPRTRGRRNIEVNQMCTDRNVEIAGTGSYLPDRILTNFDLEKMVETNDEWIVQRTGISERRMKADGQATSDMAYAAAVKALEAAELKPKDLNLIIVGTVTPDSPFPSVGCHLQRMLGTPFIPAFDVSAACTGFLFSMCTAAQFIMNGACENALCIGAESLSAITDYQDRNTAVLFGDGAGAVVLKAASGPGSGSILTYDLRTDGAGGELMFIPGGGSRIPTSQETVEKRLHYMKLHGKEIFRFAVEKFIEQMDICLQKTGLSADDIDIIIPHQVNIRIIDAAVKKLGFPIEKVLINIDRYGNTSSASIPIALDEAVRHGKLRKGDTVLMVAFGAGLTWGSVVVKY